MHFIIVCENLLSISNRLASIIIIIVIYIALEFHEVFKNSVITASVYKRLITRELEYTVSSSTRELEQKGLQRLFERIYRSITLNFP
jgi:hypothetical protein